MTTPYRPRFIFPDPATFPTSAAALLTLFSTGRLMRQDDEERWPREGIDYDRCVQRLSNDFGVNMRSMGATKSGRPRNGSELLTPEGFAGKAALGWAGDMLMTDDGVKWLTKIERALLLTGMRERACAHAGKLGALARRGPPSLGGVAER